jgi:DNA-binding NtrC family response regulator
VISHRSEKATILTVGQSERDQRILSACLPGARWRLRQAAGVSSGVDALSAGDIDVVISDISLQDGTWTDLRCAHTAQSFCPPIIVAAETIDARLWADALSRGAYDVLIKPFNTEEVLYVVRNAWLNRLHGLTPQLLPALR